MIPEADKPPRETGEMSAFWRRHALWPALLFATAFLVLWATDLDLWLADTFFYGGPALGWIGAGTWWAARVIHTGGAWLARAKCYPGAHTSSGFALLAVYFLLRERRPRAARRSLAGVILLGMILSFGQQSRGAHFLSHDLTSAAIAWFLSLALWQVMLRRRSGANSREGG